MQPVRDNEGINCSKCQEQIPSMGTGNLPLSQVMLTVCNSSISALIIWRLDGVDSRKNGRREISRDPVASVLLMNFSVKEDGEERLSRSCGGDQRPYFSRWELLVYVHALGGNPVHQGYK